MMSEERADDLAAAASSTTTRAQRYSGGQLTLSGSGRDNAGDCKEKEQEAHMDDAKDPDVTNTTHIDDVEEVNPAATAHTADSAEDIAGTVQDLGDNTVDQRQVTDEQVIYLHKADAENKLRDEKKQPFMLYSQKKDVIYVNKSVAENMLRDEKKQSFILESSKKHLKISSEGKYEEGIHWNKEEGKHRTGACAEIFIAVDKTTGHQFVVKLVHDEERDWKSTLNEMRILFRLNNKHIVRPYGCMPNKERCPIFMEYIRDETLAEHIKKKYKNKEVVLNLEVVLKILSQLLECLAHMEKEKVTHGDITFDNIMVSTNWHIHLIDFGNGCVLDDRHSSDKHDDDLYTVFKRFIYMIALCSPWKSYKGFELFRCVEKGEFDMFDKTPQLIKLIKDGLSCKSAAQMRDRVDTKFIKDIVALNPAVYGEHVEPPCGGTPMHNNKDDEFIGIPIQESFKAHVEEQ